MRKIGMQATLDAVVDLGTHRVKASIRHRIRFGTLGGSGVYIAEEAVESERPLTGEEVPLRYYRYDAEGAVASCLDDGPLVENPKEKK